MAVVAAITVAFLVVGAMLAAAGAPSGGANILGVLMAVTAFGVGIWMTLALISKRVRDTGLAPLPLMIGAVVLLAIDDVVLTRFTDLRFISPFARQTPLGGLLATRLDDLPDLLAGQIRVRQSELQ